MLRPVPTIAILASLAMLASLASESSAQDQKPAAQPATDTAATCFNFRNVTDYRISGPTQIRVKTSNGQSFDLDLFGAACLSGDAMASIERAPVSDLCLGAPPVERKITLARKDTTSVTCNIVKVSQSATTAK